MSASIWSKIVATYCWHHFALYHKTSLFQSKYELCLSTTFISFYPSNYVNPHLWVLFAIKPAPSEKSFFIAISCLVVKLLFTQLVQDFLCNFLCTHIIFQTTLCSGKNDCKNSASFVTSQVLFTIFSGLNPVHLTRLLNCLYEISVEKYFL